MLPTTDVADLVDQPRVISVHRSPADRRFRFTVRSAAASVLLLLALIGLFLVKESIPAIQDVGLWKFLTTQEWRPNARPPLFGVASLLFGTVVIATIALVVAVPLAISTALFINEYSPRRFRRGLIALVDLLAAVPSVIYGLWGRDQFQNQAIGLSKWLSKTFGFIPIFEVDGDRFVASSFIAALVVALMVLPIATSVIREVFSQAPPGEKEGALALGATRWGMIRTVVLPFGKGGIIGGSMLALGRALGETIAVALIISPSFKISELSHVLQTGGNSIASHIALRFGEEFGSKTGRSALLAAGLVLFAATLVVNMFASAIVSRSRSGQGVEI